MMKRIFSVVLVAAMLICMVPAAVTAEGTVTKTDKAGTHDTSTHACDKCGSTDWKPWTDTTSLPTEDHYYLTDDVTMSAPVSNYTGTVHICLNGYTVKAPSGKHFMNTNGAAEVVITDCTAYTDADGEYHAGSLYGGRDTLSTGGAFFVRRNGKLYLYDGIITDCASTGHGGAIQLQAKSGSTPCGKFYMYGGEISNCTAKSGSTYKIGGAVMNFGEFYMYDGTISGCTGQGGALGGHAAAFSLNGGKLIDNVGSEGGAIYAKGASVVKMTNMTVTGNTGTLGSAIYVQDTTQVTIKDSTVTGNTGSQAVHMNATGNKLTLEGKTVIKDNQGGNVYLIKDHAGIVASGLTADSKVGVTLAADRISAGQLQVTTAAAGTSADYFTSDSSDYEPKLENDQVVLSAKSVAPPEPEHSHNGCSDASCTDHAAIAYTKWTDATKLPTSGSYYLDTDVTLTTQTVMTGDLDLCLAGHTVTGPSNNRIITTGMNAYTLTIGDCTAKVENGEYKAGSLTGAVKASTKSSDTGGAIYIYSTAAFYLFDGIIEGNQAHMGGGGVHVGGTMYMENGVIRNNKAGKDGAWKAGGGINMGSNSKLYITGGEISGNEAKLGGGMYVHASATVEIADAVITGNKIVAGSGGYGAGVYAPGGTVKLAGQTQITGNTTGEAADNLYLDTNMTGVSANELAGEAKIGVTLSAGRKAKSMNITTGRTADVAKYFESDDTTLQIAQDAEVYLKPAFEHNHCVCGEAGCTEHAQVEYLAWNETDKLPTAGNYCLMTDVTLSTQTIMTGDLNLCLNGKTITGPSNNRIITTGMNAYTLTISDCTAKVENGEYKAGKLTGAVKVSTKASDTGGAVYIYSTGTFYLFDGIIEGNQAYMGGGGVQVGGTMYMYGGVIRNNKSGKDGDWKAGGGINTATNSKLYITGGEISGNEAKLGGGIYVHGTATVEITDAKILNNTATEAAGGIYLADTPAMKLSGNVQILGNTAADKTSNLVLSDKTTLALGSMGADAKVGVTASAFRYISGETVDCSQSFQSDSVSLSVIHKDGKLYMDAADGHNHCLCTAAASGCDHTSMKWAPWEYSNSLPTSGNYYLMGDVTVSAQTTLDGTTLNLCLNGHTIKSTQGRVFYTKGNTQLTIADCTGKGIITGADNSAIMTEKTETSKAVVNVFGGTFTGNTTPALGGAIVAQGGTTLNIYGGTFEKNTSIGKLKVDAEGKPVLDEGGNEQADNAIGGAAIGMYGAGTTLNIYGGTFKDNVTTHVECKTASGSVSNKGGYGIVYIQGTANVYGGSFTGGEALPGGAFFVTGEKAVLNIENATITGNYAKGGGAIVLQSGATVNLKGGTIQNNTCGGAGGGAIYVSTDAKLNMTGGTVDHNTSPGNGGALYVTVGAGSQIGGTANLTGGTISGNTAGVNGAGVYVNRATAIFNGTAVKGNTAKNNGGGIYGAGATLIQIDKSEISGNKAKNAGGIYATQNQVSADTLVYSTVTVNDGAVISGNKGEVNCGGIMLVGKGSVLNLNGGTISGNSAKNGGGVLAMTSSTVNMKGGKITGNKASVGGGGMYISVETKLNMSGGTITNNDAEGNGGGMLVQRGIAKFTGGTISGNTATTAAGVYFAGAKADIYNISITGNTARKNCGGMMLGANDYTQNGVKMSAKPVVNMYGGTISGNSAPKANAGGVLIQSKDSTFNFHGGSIVNNTCAVGGGAVYVSVGAIMNMDGGTITGNEAKQAGAIFCQKGTTTITGGEIHGNTATAIAGALLVNGDVGVMTLKNMDIHSNFAPSAGAIEVQNFATLNMENCKVRDNESESMAGGIYVDKVSFGNLKNVEIYNNVCSDGGGGGMAIAVGATVVADNITVENNRAGGIGGGIYNRGRLELNNSLVRGNSTTGNGGGIGTYKTSSIPLSLDAGLFVTNTLITGNQSVKGAGVYLHVGCISSLKDVTVEGNTSQEEGSGIFSGGQTTLENVTVTGNTSKTDLYALYFDAALYDGHTYYTGKKILSGKIVVQDNQGGEAYLGEGTAIAIPGAGLTEGTSIPITLHSGLLTNQVIGIYGYEGGSLVYTITAGDRSITDPETAPVSEEPEPTEGTEATQATEPAKENTMLYAGVGAFAVVIAAAAVIVVLVNRKKKKAEEASAETTQE